MDARTDQTIFSVVASLHSGDRSTLLGLASALHRRGVDVLTAELTCPVEARRTFEATILATARQAETVEATLRNLVHVAEVRVVASSALMAVAGGAIG